jgi:hypothetical protein
MQQQNTQQFNLLQARMSLFQTVYSSDVRQQVMVVHWPVLLQRLLVESSFFFSCSTTLNYGGAIYFSNSNNGECVLRKVCGSDCISTYSSSSGQFVYTLVQNTASNKNYVDYSSISRCVNHNSNSYYTLYLCYGKVYCPSINISMNKCYCRTIINSPATLDSSYVTSLVSYSSFTDNIASEYNFISQTRNTVKAEMKCCNIIRKTQGSPDTEAALRFDGDTSIKDSCILMNTATNTFYTISSYVITVSNCTVDSTNHINSLVLTNTLTKSFIHALNHISTQNCASEYDSVGTLTVIIPPKKKVLCYTFNCNCQAGINELISLAYLSMVTFIHSNPS